jgi:hypothetical protein
MLHLLNEFWRDFGNTPTSYLPGFELVFFSNSRTVSGSELLPVLLSFNACEVGRKAARNLL